MVAGGLPHRRESVTQSVRIGPSKVYITVGFYDEERTRLGEIFISLEKTGSERRAIMDEVARLASKLLQYGSTVEELAEGWVGVKSGEDAPSGPVSGDPRIKMCSSVLDYVGRYLLVYYCSRGDLAHATPA
jgi:ribonucleoside-diphosphate reductase alpha chain